MTSLSGLLCTGDISDHHALRLVQGKCIAFHPVGIIIPIQAELVIDLLQQVSAQLSMLFDELL
jgi:hypothetical protein